MGRTRLEDVTCAICYDSLFNKRDDLRDLVPIATCDCGHVFHEPCLLEWFRTQSDQYLTAAREQGIDGRFGSPTLSDAPAECPTCRAECFADPETGQPSIHRLFIDFDSALDASVSQIGSSPLSDKIDRKGKGKQKEEEVLNLARRAKGIREEARGLSADSEEADMEGMLRRGEGLVSDLVGMQVLDTVRSYIEGLTKEIKSLRRNLQNNPLIPNLNEQVLKLQDQLATLDRQSRQMIQREKKKAKDEEEARWKPKIKQAEEERDLIKRAYEKEKVLRRNGIRSMEERVADSERRLEEVSRQLGKEKEDRLALQATLQERTQQLKLSTKRVEDRKDLKRQLAALQAENERLKTNNRGSAHTPIRDDLAAEDPSIQEISGSHLPAFFGSPKRHSKAEDESLQIDMSVFEDSFVSPDRLLPARTSLKPKLQGARPVRSHPTARIMEFNLDSRSNKENHDFDKDKDRRRSTSSKYFPSSSSASGEEGWEDMIDHPKKKSTSTTPADKAFISNFVKRSATNPFQTTKQSIENRRQLPSLSSRPSDKGIIDMTESPKSDRLLKRESNSNAVASLGLADKNGRPKKGIVSGQKVKRKAQGFGGLG
ncbi:uncharacterized protein I303_106623 [Kwoniella dejecticola CBS 10117]|uniref:RING-type domain-containing protein n=1 Tax=Kwoniella dejecticola CBS 10117 TaxID=1296121 RepID=A0A1A5ZU66_9TREE|nr:uncharacterized protein I303_08118 [Kwoniella dejecticola CBS 10117]OBR81348.1 hypothetical protein I303_08118 [Kwoniella dejecticola CBS 10117]